jgi:hypothetical protein
MKWTYSIRQKMTAALLLGLVFVLVFIKNRMDSSNVSSLGSSFSSVYEDRLVVEMYIYELSNLLYQKKMLLDNCEGSYEAARIGDFHSSIREIVGAYGKTVLTEEEAVLFDSLKRSLQELALHEQSLMSKPFAGEARDIEQIDRSFASATNYLKGLSDIQIEVGKSMNERSKRLVASNSLLTHFEMVLLILIGIIIQSLIFASRTIATRFPDAPGMN